MKERPKTAPAPDGFPATASAARVPPRDAQADGVKARDVRASWQKNLRSSLGNSLVPASAPRFRAGRSHDAHVGHVMRNRAA